MFPIKLASRFWFFKYFFDFCITLYVGSGSRANSRTEMDPEPECIPVPVPLRQKVVVPAPVPQYWYHDFFFIKYHTRRVQQFIEFQFQWTVIFIMICFHPFMFPEFLTLLSSFDGRNRTLKWKTINSHGHGILAFRNFWIIYYMRIRIQALLYV